MYLHPCASGYTDERIADACARVRLGAHAVRADTCERFPSAWTASGFGAQAFNMASAFNADIGAWNTASVSNMCLVCVAFLARAARHRRRDALGGSSVRRTGPLGAAAPPMRARVCVRRYVGACACVPVCRYN